MDYDSKSPDPIDAFNKALDASKKDQYVLRLYISGNTQSSANAIRNLHKICEEHLKGRYKLEVIDIRQQPELAQSDQIIAAPTLVKHLPPPLRRMIGDFSKTEKVLVGLNISRVDPGPSGAGGGAAQ